MNTELSIIIDPQVADKKAAAWSNMGRSAYEAELRLQAMTQAAIKNIVIPATIDQVPAATVALTELKRAKNAIQADRMLVTKPLDDFASRIMQNEKSFDAPIKQLNDAIVSIKSAHEKEERAKKEKAAEEIEIKRQISVYMAEKTADYRKKINEAVSLAFEHALNHNIAPGTQSLIDFIAKCETRFVDTDFIPTRPNILGRIHSAGEIFELITAYFNFNPWGLLEEHKEALRFKFFDYEVAFHNKEEALLKSKQEAEAAKKKIEEEKQSKEVAATIESMATPPVNVGTQVSALKRSFAVDMEESLESSIKIMAAFVANVAECSKHLKVTKWDSLSISQMKNTLGKVKSEDNNFSFTGLTFKEVEKL